MADTEQAPAASLKLGRSVKILLFAMLVIALNFGATWLSRQIEFQLFPRHDSMLQFMVLGAAMLFVLLMATPFMPGIEIGLALMILLGSKGAVLIYLCTLLALSCSFLVGRKAPSRLLLPLLNWFHLYKASALVARLEPLNSQQRLKLLYQKTPSKLLPFLLRHRYLAFVVILNVPGNALIGGGGGIGVVAGMSKIFPFHIYVFLVAVAVAPLPLLFYFDML